MLVQLPTQHTLIYLIFLGSTVAQWLKRHAPTPYNETIKTIATVRSMHRPELGHDKKQTINTRLQVKNRIRKSSPPFHSRLLPKFEHDCEGQIIQFLIYKNIHQGFDRLAFCGHTQTDFGVNSQRLLRC